MHLPLYNEGKLYNYSFTHLHLTGGKGFVVHDIIFKGFGTWYNLWVNHNGVYQVFGGFQTLFQQLEDVFWTYFVRSQNKSSLSVYKYNLI
jgi:hypothetical protein